MTRIFTGIDCLSHDAGYGFPESPERLVAEETWCWVIVVIGFERFDEGQCLT